MGGRRKFIDVIDYGTVYREHREPPRPTAPSPAYANNYFTERFQIDHRQFYIRLDTLDEVKGALRVFAGGASSGRTGLADEGSMMLSCILPSPGSFVERVIKSMVSALNSERHRYDESWDWEGPGPFQKASVQVEQKDGFYTLHIYAAHVGNRPEIRLAERINKPIGYNRCEIHRFFAPGDSGRFRIPVAEISAALMLAGANPDDCEGMIVGMLQPKMCDHSPSRVERLTSAIKFEANGLSVYFDLTSYTIASPYRGMEQAWEDYAARVGTKDRDMEIRIEDGFLTGPADIDHNWTRPKAAAVEMHIYTNDPYNTETEAAARAVGAKIQNAWLAAGIKEQGYME